MQEKARQGTRRAEKVNDLEQKLFGVMEAELEHDGKFLSTISIRLARRTLDENLTDVNVFIINIDFIHCPS